MLRQRKTSRAVNAPLAKLPSEGSVCMKYYYNNDNDFNRLNLECIKRPWLGNFNDVSSYSAHDMDRYVNNNFVNQFKNTGLQSPFQFSENYHDKSMEDLCNTDSFELNPSQKFLGMFINDHTDFTGVLVNHGLGSGKTTTSIIIGEAMKSNGFVNGSLVKLPGRSPFKVFIVAPKNVQEQYLQEITGNIRNGKIRSAPAACVISWGGEKGDRQFYVGRQYPDGTYHYGKLQELERLEAENPKDPRVQILRNEIHQTISGVYEIMTHDRFLNMLIKTFEKDGVYTAEPVFTNQININNDFFHSKNSLLIIDEIHTLVREYNDKAGSNYRRLYHMLMFYSRQRENGLPAIKIVLLTGTPIYDNPHESALILNLLRPRMPFPLSRKKFEELFVDKANSVGKNLNLFKYMCSGYVSYFKGGNPNGFPFRTNHIVYHRMRDQQEASYNSSYIYESEKEEKLKKLKKRKKEEDEEAMSTYFQLSVQKCNIAYPTRMNQLIVKPQETKVSKEVVPKAPKEPKDAKVRRTIKLLFGAKGGEGDDSDVKNNASHVHMFSKYLNELGGQFDVILREVEKWSMKFAKIIKLIYESPGPVFIYTRYVQHGIIGLALILNALGWGFIGSNRKTEAGTYAIWSPGALESLSVIDGLTSIESSKQDSYIKAMKTVFNSPSNRDGSRCKVLISNVVEGISLRRVTQVHVCEPWWNMSEMEQIVARAIRFCSHSDVPENQKQVDVYYHSSVYKYYSGNNPGPDDVTMNQKIFRTALRKQKLNLQFEQALKESAIDCNLNKFGNIVRLEKVMIQDLKIESLYYDRTTNSYYLADIVDNNLDRPMVGADLRLDRSSIGADLRLDLKGINLIYGEEGRAWPANGFEYNSKEPPTVLSVKQVNDKAMHIIVRESIKCMGEDILLSKPFNELYAHSVSRGESKEAWKYCYDLYRKNMLLPQLIVKYNICDWGIGGQIMNCLYSKLLNPKKYNLTKADESRMCNFLFSKEARLKNTKRYREMLYNKSKLDPVFIDKLNYAQLEILAKKYLGHF